MTVGTSTTVSLIADGVDLPMAKRKFSIETARLFKISASIVSSSWFQCFESFSLLQTTRPNKLECLYLANPFQSSLAFAGNTRGLPKNEAPERSPNWVASGLAFKF